MALHPRRMPCPRTVKNWNNLPSDIKNSSTITQFKNLINKYYLDRLSLVYIYFFGVFFFFVFSYSMKYFYIFLKLVSGGQCQLGLCPLSASCRTVFCLVNVNLCHKENKLN